MVAKILGYYDMDHMYPNKFDNPGLCPVCHNTIEQIPDVMYKVCKKKGDVFCTYDGFTIVTEKFKQFCEDRKYPHLIFTPLVKSPGYYFFLPQDIYKLDYERHANIQMYQRIEGSNRWKLINVPGTKEQNFHIFLNLVNKYVK